MAGLLDHHTFLGNKLALEMVVDEAKYFQSYLVDILSNEGKDHWVQMLDVEYGGMEEVLFKLYQATEDQQWQRCVLLLWHADHAVCTAEGLLLIRSKLCSSIANVTIHGSLTL